MRIGVHETGVFVRCAETWPAFRCSLVPALDEHDPPLAAEGSCLWVHVRSKPERDRLDGFLPAPTLLLSGTHGEQTAVWALDKPLEWEWIERGGKRLAKWMGARQKDASAGFLAPADHIEAHDRIYSAREVVGHLPDPPSMIGTPWHQTAS